MDAETFKFYLGKTPAEYTAVDDLVTLDRVLDDLQALHGARKAFHMGLAFLAAELRDHMAAELGVTPAAGRAARALGLLRDLLTLYEGQRLAPPETYASYWQDVRALLTEAEGGRADG